MSVNVSQRLTERLSVKCRLNKQCVGSERSTINHLYGQTPTECSVGVSDASNDPSGQYCLSVYSTVGCGPTTGTQRRYRLHRCA